MRKHTDIHADSKTEYDVRNEEILIDIPKLLQLIKENGCEDGQLVVEFYDDYYNGLSYQGLAIRPKDAAPYGYCPICKEKSLGNNSDRYMGKDHCENGHKFTYGKALRTNAPN